MKYSILLIFSLFHLTLRANDNYFRFSALPVLPPNTGMEIQPGLAGPYTGMDDNILLLAGGANFPELLPWEGGEKKFYDEIFLLEKKGENEYIWKNTGVRIPVPSAYGGAVPTPAGLYCFGGNTATTCISSGWLIDFDPVSGEVSVREGPQLPVPLASFACALVDGYLYVAGGLTDLAGSAEKHFFSMQVSGNDPSKWQWEELPPWNGKPRAFAVGAGQNNGVTNCFYLFSGRDVQPGKDPEVLYDAHVYDPSLKTWKVISEGQNMNFPVMAGTAFSAGASSIVFPSGADGILLQRQLQISQMIRDQQEKNAPPQVVDSLQNLLLSHLNDHPGFGNRMWIFNTITRSMYEAGGLPGTGQVTTTAVKYGNEVYIPSGEIRPGIRTPGTLKISLNRNTRHLYLLDFIVIALYFLILAVMGWFFSRRQKNTEDYFKGGGRVPWWAAGLSIFGTALSAITFMAIPSKTFATDWSYFMLNMTIFMVAPFIIYVFIPFYRRLNITTAYEFLEMRFNLAVRLMGSISFILFQVGRMGVVLFLPSIALNVVTGMDIFLCIALMGVISLVYTMMGGIEAVIWTDVMQVIVLLGGALLSLAVIIMSVDGGLVTMAETASQHHKFNIIDLSLSLKQPTLWVMLLGGVFANITTYGTDQTMVQRYLTTKSKKAAQQSVWTNAILTIPATIIFFSIGTALFVFYRNFPETINPTFDNNDAIFPWYIASQLPAGISGLLIAGIFAAAMSTLSSSMNSAATAYATDVHFRFGWNKSTGGLKIARMATLVIGTIGIIFAFFMATLDIKSLWDEFQKILGLVIGSLGGVFLLGMLTKRANGTGTLIGIIISIIVQIAVAAYQPVHLIAYTATGVISCFVTGYLASLIFRKTSE